ncbi:MAG: transcriptional regulator NrdR [Fibromonadaceae bacterium]|jgi:transcriptional repressor NrdR|nr:transcriptional regulator NrdR [Fibromonadaceae bacterium]
MICPNCKADNDKVIDTRASGDSVRRRRECLNCSNRFTTYEYVEKAVFSVVKRDERREAFMRDKLASGIRKACVKRSISSEVIDKVVSEVENELTALGQQELSYRVVGDLVMRKLQGIDPVAYVRFASVYKEFQEVGDFSTFLAPKALS